MADTTAYRIAEQKFEKALRIQATGLDLSGSGDTRLTELPESLGQLTQLLDLNLSGNRLTVLPESLGRLTQLESLDLSENQLAVLPESLTRLTRLAFLYLSRNRLTALLASLGRLDNLERLEAKSNPFHPELAAAVGEGLDTVKRYLRAQAAAGVALNEAKLILIGEDEVGKSCLFGALRGDPWEEDRPTTHGIEIKPVRVTNPGTGTEIRLNGWDFSGQRVYRPTHQLFFTAPAVYLVVWKPREGPQQGFVIDRASAQILPGPRRLSGQRPLAAWPDPGGRHGGAGLPGTYRQRGAHQCAVALSATLPGGADL